MYLLLFLLAVLPLASDEQNYVNATLTSGAETFIEGSVSAMTGAYVARETDFSPATYISFPLQRHYISSGQTGRTVTWEFLPHLCANVYYKGPNEITEVKEPDGTIIKYINGTPSLGNGYCHTSGHSLINNRAVASKDALEIYLANGGYRLYKDYGKKPHILLTKERLPNGALISYTYDGKSINPKSIEVRPPSSTGKRYLRYEFEYINWCKEDQKINIYLCTKKTRKLVTSYYFSAIEKATKKKPNVRCKLVRTESIQNAPEEVSYKWGGFYCLDVEGKAFSLKRFLTEKKIAGAKEKKIVYYQQTDNPNDTGPQFIYLVNYPGLCETHGKVYSLSVPHNSAEEATYRFYYGSNTSAIDPEGNRTVYVRDKKGRLKSIKKYRGDTLYAQEEYTWSKEGDLERKQLFDKTRLTQTETYTYDAQHNILSHTVEGDFIGDGTIQKRTTQYTYIRPKHAYLLATKTTPNGVREEYTYLEGTNLLTSVKTYAGEKLHTTETYRYSADHVLIEKRRLAGDITLTTRITPKTSNPALHRPAAVEVRGGDTLISRIEYEYNRDHLPTQERHYGSDGKLAYTLNKQYDERGRLISETDPLGRKKTIAYDAFDKPTDIADDAVPYRIQNTYDPRHRLVKEEKGPRTTSTTYDAVSRLTSETDHRGHTTYTTYGQHHLEMATRNTIASTKTTYDFCGRPISTIDPDGYETKTAYNILGQPIQIDYPDSTCEIKRYTTEGYLSVHTLPNGTTVHYTYDHFGRVLQEETRDETGNLLAKESNTYSPLHLLSHTDALGVKTSYTYDSCGRKVAEITGKKCTEYHYDSLSRLSKTIRYITKESAEVTINTFDHAGRLIETKETDLRGTLYSRETYDYNLYDQKITTHIHDTGQTFTTKMTYDLFSRPTSITDPLGNTYTTSYTETPFLKTEKTDPKGRCITTIHDRLDRPVLSEAYHNDRLLARHAYTYTPAGDKTKELITVIQPGAPPRTIQRTWTYDTRHRPILFIDADRQTTHTTYTPTGKIATKILPSNTTLFYTYNALDQNTRLQTDDIDYTYTYDQKGRLLTANGEGKTTTRTYDIYGNATSETLANGLTLKRTYDLLDRPTSLTYPDGSQTHYTYDAFHLHTAIRNDHHHIYTYDQRHHVICEKTPSDTINHSYNALSQMTRIASDRVTDEIHTFDTTSNPLTRTLNNTPYTYTYDDYDHLASEPDHTYTYDSAHNRHTHNEYKESYNELNQNAAFTYDSNGNLLSDGDHTYCYDALSRLIAVDDHSLSYDPLNRLIAIDDTHILYDNDLDIGTYEHGKPLHLRILGNTPSAEIGSTILIELRGKPYTPSHDLFGNIVHLDRSYTYPAYGTTHDSPNPWQYQSKRVLSHLLYFTNRFYDPAQGRFLTPDPLGYTDAPNLYHYALSSPLSHNDPWGLLSLPVTMLPVPDSLDSPRVQGVLQTIAGIEGMAIAARAGMTFIRHGRPLPATMALGLLTYSVDQAQTGIESAMRNLHVPTWTQVALEKSGLSPETAATIDNTFGSMLGMGLSTRAYRSALKEFPRFPNALNTTSSLKNTTLYRAVSPTELADIRKSSIFRNMGHAEGKYFTTSMKDASFYAKQAVKGFGDPPYTLVRTQAPESIFEGLSSAVVDRGIPAWVIPDQKLKHLHPEVMKWMPTPPRK